MKITIVPVTNDNVDKICDRYTSCGWKENNVFFDSTNRISSVEFIWENSGQPEWPSISDLL